MCSGVNRGLRQSASRLALVLSPLILKGWINSNVWLSACPRNERQVFRSCSPSIAHMNTIATDFTTDLTLLDAQAGGLTVDDFDLSSILPDVSSAFVPPVAHTIRETGLSNT